MQQKEEKKELEGPEQVFEVGAQDQGKQIEGEE